MKYLILILSLTAGFSAQARPSNAQLQKLAHDYLVQKQLNFRSTATVTHENCAPTRPPSTLSPKSCINTVCSKMDKFACDDPSEINEVAILCKGNIDGDCVDTICHRLGKFECDDYNELAEITNMCKGPNNKSCIDVACNHLGKFNCDDISEMKAVTSSLCTPYVDSSCITSVCSRLGKFDCDDITELQTIAQSCSL